MTQEFIKDPNSTLDYKVDWTSWLGGDVIVSACWIVPNGIVSSGSVVSSTTSTIWLSSGCRGEAYNVVNRIMTSSLVSGSPRIDERTITITIRDK